MENLMRVVVVYSSWNVYKNELPPDVEMLVRGHGALKLGGGMFLLNGNDSYETELAISVDKGNAFVAALAQRPTILLEDRGVEDVAL